MFISSIAKMIIDLLTGLLSFQPITEITLTGLLILYVQYLIVAFILAFPITYLCRKMVLKHEKKITYKAIFILVPLENLIFRMIPLFAFGANGLIVGHIIWAIAHVLPPSICFIGISGLLIARLWLGGQWLLGFLVHLFHDLFWFTLLEGLKNINKRRHEEEDESTDRETEVTISC